MFNINILLDEVKNQFINCLENFDKTYAFLVEVAFADYHFSEDEAINLLKALGKDNVVDWVVDFECVGFSEVTTDLNNPFKLVNSFFYELGETLLYGNEELYNLYEFNSEEMATKEMNDKFIEVIKGIESF